MDWQSAAAAVQAGRREGPAGAGGGGGGGGGEDEWSAWGALPAAGRDISVSTPSADLGLPSASRYRQEFEELSILGEGGFGAVFLCRNRLDGQCYAIKKIRLDPDNDLSNKKMLREVKTLSGLHHQSVVRYFQAWIEGGRTSDLGGGEGEGEGEDKGSIDDSNSDSEDSDLMEDSIFNADFVHKVNSASNSKRTLRGFPDSDKDNEKRPELTIDNEKRPSPEPQLAAPASSTDTPSALASDPLVGMPAKSDAATDVAAPVAEPDVAGGKVEQGSEAPSEAAAAWAATPLSPAAKPATSGDIALSAVDIGMVSVLALSHERSQPWKPGGKASRSVHTSIHDELMQDHSVRRLDDQPLAMSWSDDSYSAPSEDMSMLASGSSADRQQGSGGSAERIISRFASMFGQVQEEKEEDGGGVGEGGEGGGGTDSDEARGGGGGGGGFGTRGKGRWWGF